MISNAKQLQCNKTNVKLLHLTFSTCENFKRVFLSHVKYYQFILLSKENAIRLCTTYRSIFLSNIVLYGNVCFVPLGEPCYAFSSSLSLPSRIPPLFSLFPAALSPPPPLYLHRPTNLPVALRDEGCGNMGRKLQETISRKKRRYLRQEGTKCIFPSPRCKMGSVQEKSDVKKCR